MSRQRYDQIAPRLQKIERWLEEVGLSNRDRIRIHIQNITELADAQAKGTLSSIALDSERERELLWSFVEGLEFLDAMESLIAAGCPPALQVLERALNGPVEPFRETEKNNLGRNTMFEILLAGDIARAGLKPQLGAEPDIKFNFRDRRLLNACKRPLSAGAIQKQIEIASTKLAPTVSAVRFTEGISGSYMLGCFQLRPMAGITLDVATLRAAHRILTCPRDSRHDQGRFLDLDLAALGNVVEAIILFDDILVPDLGHSDLAALLQPFGPAIRIWSVSTAARKSIATQARQWMASWNNIEAFIRVLGASPLYANVGGGTFWYLVLEAVGARDKYQSNVIQLLRSMWSYDQEFGAEKPTVIYNNRWYQDPNQAIPNIPPRVPDYIEHLQTDDEVSDATLASPGWKDGTEKVRYFENDILNGILFEMGLPPLKLGQTSQAPYWTSYPTEVWTANKETFTFCANLAWLTFRCKCYELASRKIGSPYMPHPLRSNLAGFSMATDGLEAGNAADQIAFAKAYVDVLKQVRDESAEKAKFLGRAAFQPLAWSPLLPHVARKAKRGEHVVNTAYELRGSLGARNLRKAISRVEKSVQQGNLKSALRFCEEIQELGAAIRSDLGIFEPSPKLTVSFAGFGSAEVPTGAVPKFLKRKRYPFKPRFTFMRSVFDDLMTISSLGSVYEMICPLGPRSTPPSDPN